MSYKNEDVWKELKAEVLEELNFFDNLTDEIVFEVIDRVIKVSKHSKNISLNSRCLLRMELFHSIRKLDVIEELLEDPTITEIMINGEKGIFIEREGQLESFPTKKISKEQLEELVNRITAKSNRIINEATPLTDARLEDGSRVHVAVSPVALESPVITIRKFPKKAITLEDLLERESLNEEIANFLKRVVKAKYNIFVSGSTGSGKTTLLNVLSDFIPKQERVITIEDTAELQIRNIPNLVRLEARSSVVEGCKEISIRDLLRACLRMRPDRIIVGEVRGAETVDMIQAFCTGNDGSMSTGHGNSTKDMLYRLDRDLEDFITFLMAQVVDPSQVVITLTSDHGTSPSFNSPGREHERFNVRQAEVIINAFIGAQHGNGEWVLGYIDRGIYLNHNLIYEKNLSLADMQYDVATFVMQLRGVSHAISSEAMRNSYFGSGYGRKIQNGFYPRRSGDVIVNLMPDWIEESDELRSASGSMYRYDTQVPLLIYGGGVKAAERGEQVDLTSLATTQAQMLGIVSPSAAEGEELMLIYE